jgi:hypothetical protein
MGEETVPFKYEQTKHFSEGMAGIKLKNKWGVVDTSGREVVPPRFEYIGFFSDSITWFLQDKKEGYIDLEGILLYLQDIKRAGCF